MRGDCRRCGALSRSAHVIGALLPVWLVQEGVIAGVPQWGMICLLVGVAVMPVLWLCGTLPPLDAGGWWLAEQVAVHGWGASAAATPARLTLTLAGGALSVALIWVSVAPPLCHAPQKALGGLGRGDHTRRWSCGARRRCSARVRTRCSPGWWLRRCSGRR